jgi:hypothetical protein
MERYCSTGQSPQRAVAPTEEEEEYIYIYKVQLKSTLQQTENFSVAALPPCRLCYRPTVLFSHLCLAVLSFQQGKVGRVSKIVFFYFLF